MKLISEGEALATGRHGAPDGRTESVICPIDRKNRGSTLLVFVPGLAGNARQWDLVLPQLDDLPVDFAYGAPLHGASPTAPDLALAYAEELRRENRRDVVLVAHSVGTFVALGVAHHASDIVKEVIAVNGGLTIAARFLNRPIRTFRERPRDCLNALRLFALVGTPAPPPVKRAIANSERWSRIVFGSLVSDAALKSVERRRIVAEEGGKPAAMLTLWSNRHHWREFCSYADDISSRCVFLAGGRDPVAKVSDTWDMAELLRSAKTEVKPLEGVGHAAPVENPERVSALIREALAALSLG